MLVARLCSVFFSFFPALPFLVMAQPAAGACPAAAAAAPAPPPRPVVLPDEFARTSAEDWVTYLARFDAACVVNGYTPVQRLQFLPCRLTGAAFQVHTAILARQPNATYPQLCAALGAAFNPPQQGPIVEAELCSQTKQSGETQIEFASALQQLAARAFPGQQQTPLYERMLLNQFIEGQASPELRLHIRSTSLPDLDTAVRRALEMAAVFNSEARRATPFVLPSIPPPTTVAAVAATAVRPGSDRNEDVYELLQKISMQLSSLQHLSSAPSPRWQGPPPAPPLATAQGFPRPPPPPPPPNRLAVSSVVRPTTLSETAHSAALATSPRAAVRETRLLKDSKYNPVT